MKSKRKRVIFCAAGTGGHLFPAQQLATELQEEYEILFAGKNLSKNPYFSRHDFAFLEVNAATFSLLKPWTLFKATFAIIEGFFQSLAILHRYKPALMIGFGSFFSLPLLLAAKVKNVPIILHEQNLLPGRVNRLFARHALFLATTFPTTEKYVKGRIQRVSFPQRLHDESVNRKEAAAYFGLSEDPFTLLIFGGSQGALFLNQLAPELIVKLQHQELQILHFVGKEGEVEKLNRYYKEHKVKAVVKSFEPHMKRAYLLADIAICRSGAATINELLECALPACLIPFPLATDDHQTKNAEFFVDVVQGGWLYSQNEATLSKIVTTICSCDREKLLAKKRKIQEYVKEQQKRVRSLSLLIKEIM